MVYSYNGNSFAQSRLLMPDDLYLPPVTSVEETRTLPTGVQISGKAPISSNGIYGMNGGNGTSITLQPYTAVALVDSSGIRRNKDYQWLVNNSNSATNFTMKSSLNDQLNYVMVGTIQASSVGYISAVGSSLSVTGGSHVYSGLKNVQSIRAGANSQILACNFDLQVSNICAYAADGQSTDLTFLQRKVTPYRFRQQPEAWDSKGSRRPVL